MRIMANEVQLALSSCMASYNKYYTRIDWSESSPSLYTATSIVALLKGCTTNKCYTQIVPFTKIPFIWSESFQPLYIATSIVALLQSQEYVVAFKETT